MWNNKKQKALIATLENEITKLKHQLKDLVDCDECGCKISKRKAIKLPSTIERGWFGDEHIKPHYVCKRCIVKSVGNKKETKK